MVKSSIDSIGQARSSLRTLFFRPDADGQMLSVGHLLHGDFLALLDRIFLPDHSDQANDRPSFADYLNLLGDFCGARRETILNLLLQSGFELLVQMDAVKHPEQEDGAFIIRHLTRIIDGLIALGEKLQKLETVTPRAKRLFEEVSAIDEAQMPAMLQKCDPFALYRTFRYDGKLFHPVVLENIRAADKFFGFAPVLHIFEEQFQFFSAGINNVPLLVSSLPGHGKTQMAIAHTLKHDNLTLILANPPEMEQGLPELLRRLAERHDRKFVLFFDDVMPEDVDWYYFRTHIGGAYSLPENVLVVAASNYHFPPSILSRGRSVLFPVFDEVRCMEMVEGFLISCKLRHPKQNLISMITTDYTEQFGQKKFTELSPRTLMRYLKIYEQDQSKRRTMLDLANGEMIFRPDTQLFYEFNIQLMRKLYGKEFIETLLKERLHELEENN